MNIYKEVTISFSPLRLLLGALGVLMCLVAWGIPSPVSHPSADAKLVNPDPIVIAEIANVENELRGLQGVTASETHEVAFVLVTEAHKYGFDPLFIVAVIEAESNFDAEACSATRARGLMQIVPSTWKTLTDSPKMFDPVENVKAGIKYLAKLSTTFKRVESILMAYNGGPGKATAFIKASAAQENVDDFSAEMKGYPGKVMFKYAKLLQRNGKNPKLARTSFRTAK